MNVAREFKLISQKFDSPHVTSKRKWEVRESIVLREINQNGDFVYGEIAPVPGFPEQPKISDILDEAKNWSLSQNWPESSILEPALSCMKSKIWKMKGKGFGKKIERSDFLSSHESESRKFSIKKKIGLLPILEEIKKTKEWFQTLDQSCKVRLDANGCLTMDELQHWKDEFLNEKRIEYLEQPVSDDLREDLFDFARQTKFPLAIDETIVALGSPQAAKEKDWNGYYVIKPTLLHDWNSTLNFARENPEKSVFSTVYESPFGYEALIRACIFSELKPGIGRTPFGHIPTELPAHHAEIIRPPSVTISELDVLWTKF